MARKWKNSDDETYYSDKSKEGKLERLRKELIKDYGKVTHKKGASGSYPKKPR